MRKLQFISADTNMHWFSIEKPGLTFPISKFEIYCLCILSHLYTVIFVLCLIYILLLHILSNLYFVLFIFYYFVFVFYLYTNPSSHPTIHTYSHPNKYEWARIQSYTKKNYLNNQTQKGLAFILILLRPKQPLFKLGVRIHI